MMQRIWYFWEGSKPVHIQLCERTLRNKCTNFEIIQIDKSNIHNYINIDITRLHNLSLPNQSDIISYMLLYEHGGVWLDLDNIVLKPLDGVVDKLNDYDCIGYMRTTTSRKSYSLPAHSFIASRAKTNMMKEIINECFKYIGQNQSELAYEHYLDIFGEAFIRDNRSRTVPATMFEPIGWVKKSRKMFLKAESKINIDLQHTYCVHIHNNLLGKELIGKSEADLLESDSLLSYLFNIGLS